MVNTPVPAVILAVEQPAADIRFFRLQLDDGRASRNFCFTPGQFLHVSAAGAGEAPFSPINCTGDDGIIELFIKKAGHVTAKLHTLQEGDLVHIRGPFGNGFPVKHMERQNIFLLAGGLGIVPLHSLLSYLVMHRQRFGTITFMYGAKEPSALLLRQELQDLACTGNIKLMVTVEFAPEDEAGKSSCNIGLLPDLLQGTVITADKSYAAVCGPPALYKCLVGELKALGFKEERILLSLERRMKCGLGRCAHCAIGQNLCCIDGPVFRYSELKGIEGAL